MIRTLANDPAIQAALMINEARRPRLRLKDKLLLVVPFPIGCYLLVKALLVTGGSSNDPIDSTMIHAIRGLQAMEGLLCFYLSLRAYFDIRRAQKAD